MRSYDQIQIPGKYSIDLIRDNDTGHIEMRQAGGSEPIILPVMFADECIYRLAELAGFEVTLERRLTRR